MTGTPPPLSKVEILLLRLRLGITRHRRLHNLLLDIRSALVYALTLGRKSLHEGRFLQRGGQWSWRNWNRTVTLRPSSIEMPTTEEELRRLIREANPPGQTTGAVSKVRVVGGGHTFNASSQTDDLLLSLDKLSLDQHGPVELLDTYDGVELEQGEKAVRVAAGFRLRDLNTWLWEHGLALPVLGSTDAQSIGGLLATDLHGTGKDHGFLSEQVLELRVVDAKGDVTVASPQHHPDLFHAAIGGLGSCGVVTQAVLRCVPSFELEKQTWIVHQDWLEENLDGLLKTHDHVSLYRLAGVAVSHLYVNIWNRVQRPPSRGLRFRKTRAEILDWLSSAVLSDLLLKLKRIDAGLRKLLHLKPGKNNPWEPVSKLGFSALLLFMAIMTDGFLAYKPAPDRPDTKAFKLFDWLLAVTLKLTNNRPLVHPSSTGFARKLFYRHDEIEYGVPQAKGKDCLKEVMEELSTRNFVTIIEVRFTPDKSKALLGSGAGRETCFIELAPNLSRDTDAIFKPMEQILLRHGGQVHLGKKTFVDSQAMARMHPKQFAEFQKVRTHQDPRGVFMSRFTRQIFGGAPGS